MDKIKLTGKLAKIKSINRAPPVFTKKPKPAPVDKTTPAGYTRRPRGETLEKLIQVFHDNPHPLTIQEIVGLSGLPYNAVTNGVQRLRNKQVIKKVGTQPALLEAGRPPSLFIMDVTRGPRK